MTLDVPPLRERKEDIYELTQSFLHEFSLVYGRHIHSFTPEVFEDLLRYDWPGNIRELRNTIERLVIFSTEGEIRREYLPDHMYSGDKSPQPGEGNDTGTTPINGAAYQARLDEYERKLLLEALAAVKGNKYTLAKQLGISRATLYNKLKRLNL